MTEEYPHTGYILALIGGILELIVGGIWTALALSTAAALATYGGGLAALTAVLPALYLIAGVLIIVGAMKMKDPQGYKTGALLTIIFSVIPPLNIIALIGGILAYTWKPERRAGPAPPPPPPV